MACFHPLFRIVVEHSYFRGGICAKLDFVPTVKTRGIIRNSGMVLKPISGGVQLFYDDSRREVLKVMASESETAVLSFRAFSRDPLFSSYTRQPVGTDDAMLFFHDGASSSGPDGACNLHPGEYVSGEDLRALDRLADDDLLAPGDRIMRPAFLVSIALAQLDLQANALLKRFRIRFQARETFWKYYLVGAMAGKNAVISDRNNGIEFACLGEELLADNRRATVFRSMQPLRLRERSEYSFQLRASGGAGKILVRRLPVASANQLSREIVDGKEAAVSEIYLNC